MSAAPIQSVRATAYKVPTEQPESDGTLTWDAVTLVVAEVQAGGQAGIGYTYADKSAAVLIDGLLGDVLKGRDALAVPECWWAMITAIRNLGWEGVSATAIAALDIALWDLKAKLLDVCLADLLGRAHDAVPVYGSGGLTSYSEPDLCQQLSQWVSEGIPRVKMKIGRDPDADVPRVRAVRHAIGSQTELYVDANGAYSRKQALWMAQEFAQCEVSWFEEPVSSNDLDGLHLVRDHGPPGMVIAAGEYGYEPGYFRRMLDARAVDVMQVDCTRACGISGMQVVAGLCAAYQVPLSAHCAPQVHAHAGCAVGPLRHCEYFHTHARVEQMLFDGVLVPEQGALRPDPDRPGLGIELRRSQAAEFEL